MDIQKRKSDIRRVQERNTKAGLKLSLNSYVPHSRLFVSFFFLFYNLYICNLHFHSPLYIIQCVLCDTRESKAMVSPTPLDHLILLRFGGIKKIEKQDSAAQCVLLLWFEQSTTTLGQKQKNTDRLFIRRSRKKIFF